MFVHITEDDKGQPFEVFINLGKAGGSAMADAEAMGRLISLALRSGIPLRSSTGSCAGSRPIALSGSAEQGPVGAGCHRHRARRSGGASTRKASSRTCWATAAGLAGGPARETPPAAALGAMATSPAAPGSASGGTAVQGGGMPDRYADRTESFIGTCPDCG